MEMTFVLHISYMNISTIAYIIGVEGMSVCEPLFDVSKKQVTMSMLLVPSKVLTVNIYILITKI